VEGSDKSGLPEVRLRLGHNRAAFMEMVKSFQDECSLVAYPPIEYNNLTEWNKCKGMRYWSFLNFRRKPLSMSAICLRIGIVE